MINKVFKMLLKHSKPNLNLFHLSSLISNTYKGKHADGLY